MVSTFGKLSLLEVCALFPEGITRREMPCESVIRLEFKDGRFPAERLAGIRKLATSIGHIGSDGDFSRLSSNIIGFLEYSDNPTLSLSLYGGTGDPEEYNALVSSLLSVMREGGIKKVNFLRPHQGTELYASDVLTRGSNDFVVFPSKGGYEVGFTSYIPDAEQAKTLATERPAVRSEITLSPRLAEVLVNIAALAPGQTLLDPFCGSGMILSEAVLKGLDCIGVDENRARVDEAQRNADWLKKRFPSSKLGSLTLMRGDSSKLEQLLGDRRVDAVVTEPILLPKITSTPNLASASRMIKKASTTYSDVLYAIAKAVKRGGRIVIVVPALRTFDGKEVSVRLEGVEEVGLREFRPLRGAGFEYPIRVSFESTRWVKRMVYAFERV